MLRSMPVRRLKRGFKLVLIKLLIGNKAAGVHLSYVGQGARADLCRRIVDIGGNVGESQAITVKGTFIAAFAISVDIRADLPEFCKQVTNVFLPKVQI